METVEEKNGGGILRVRQLLKSVSKGFSSLKTSLASPKISDSVTRTELPSELKHMIEIHDKGNESLSTLVSSQTEWEAVVDQCAEARSEFRDAVAVAAQARGDNLTEATSNVVRLLQRVDESKKMMDCCAIDFARTMAKLQQRHSAGIQEQVAQLENARHAIDKVLAKQKLVKEKGGTAANDMEKAAKREQKLKTRRKVFEDLTQNLLGALPRRELETEHSFCGAVLSLVREQKTHAAAAASLLGHLDKTEEALAKLLSELSEQLQSADDVAQLSSDRHALQLCAPRLIETLSAPDFAVASALADLAITSRDLSAPPDPARSPLRALLRLLDDADMAAPFLKFALCNHLPRSPAALFRQPSLARSLCEDALAMACAGFLQSGFTPLVSQLCSGDADFEVDPQYLAEDESLEANSDNLCKAVQWFIDTIDHALQSAAPPLLRALAVHVFNLLGPERRSLATHVVCGLLFHCMLIPPISTPHYHGLARAEPDERSARALNLIATSLACLADSKPFPRDLPSSRAIDEVMDQNRERLAETVQQLGSGVLGGAAGEWGGLGDLDLDGGDGEGGEEEEDVRSVRGLMLEHASELARVLQERGFSAHLDDVYACLHGRPAAPLRPDASRSGSELDPEEGREGGLWSAPEEEEEEEEERPGGRAGRYGAWERLGGLVEEADEMPESLPVRFDVAGLEGGAVEGSSSTVVVERASPVKGGEGGRARGGQESAVPKGTRGKGGDGGEANEEDAEGLLRPRRRFTQARVSSSTTSDLPDMHPSAATSSDTPSAGTTPQLPVPKVARGGGIAREGSASGSKREDGERASASGGKEAGADKAKGRLFGVGAAFKRSKDGFFYVTNVVTGGPAHKAGVQVGSRVVAVGGEKLYRKPAAFLTTLVLGSESAVVSLQLQAPGASVDAAVQSLSVRSAFIDDTHLVAAHNNTPQPKQDRLPISSPPSKHHQQPQPQPQHEVSLPSVSTGLAPRTLDAGGPGGREQVGIGITFKRDGEGFFYVMRLAEGGAAAATGLVEEGDRVVEVDGNAMQGKTAQDLTRAVLGLSGTWVTLLMRSKQGKPKAVEICRSKAESEPVSPPRSHPQPPPALPPPDTQAVRGAPGAEQVRLVPTTTTPSEEPQSGVPQSVLLEGEAVGGVGLALLRGGDGAVTVHSVEAGGAAERAGVRVGEAVTAVDGVAVSSSSLAAVTALLAGPAGSTVELQLSSGAAARLTRTVGPLPAPSIPSWPQALLQTEAEPRQEAQLAGIGVWLRAKAEAGGYRVQRVGLRGRVGGSPEEGGLEVGDTVLEIDGQEVGDLAYTDMVSLLNGPLGSAVRLLLRKGEPDGRCLPVQVLRCTPPLTPDPPPDSAALAGVGITLKRDREGYFFVKRVVEGSPAQRVGGIEVGDSVREIDGFSLFRKPLPSLHQLLHGRENSIVTLGVCDGDSGAIRQVEIPRGWGEDRADSDSGDDEEGGADEELV